STYPSSRMPCRKPPKTRSLPALDAEIRQATTGRREVWAIPAHGRSAVETTKPDMNFRRPISIIMAPKHGQPHLSYRKAAAGVLGVGLNCSESNGSRYDRLGSRREELDVSIFGPVLPP